jgi:hypothetical protein
LSAIVEAFLRRLVQRRSPASIASHPHVSNLPVVGTSIARAGRVTTATRPN